MKTVKEILKAELIDYAPVFHGFGPDEILTVSGILTAKKSNFKEMLNELKRDVVEKFHEHATKRGHASLLTTPVFYFWIEGSRIIDFFLTAFPYGSYLMFSSRRIEVSMDNIVAPDEIKTCGLAKEYEKTCKNLLSVYKDLLRSGHDRARNILPLGFTSYGFFSFPAQTLFTCIYECENNENVPEELKIIAEEFKNVLRAKVPAIFKSAEKAHETGFPFPNIFGDYEINEKKGVEVVYKGGVEKIREVFSQTRDWKKVSEIGQSEILVKVVDFISVAAWNEVKRHRSVRQFVEPLYTAAERFLKKGSEELYHIPPSAGNDYKEAFHDAMAFYEKLLSEGVEKRHALYIVPHALKVKFKLLLDGYHLLDPFGFIGIRSCTTTHYEVREFVETLMEKITGKIPEISNLLGPKCKTGVCPELKPCGKVKLFERKA